jgi:Cu(I)/Ag(I) efflux system membrane fusion protein
MMDSGTEPGSTVELSENDQKAAGVQISEVRRQRLATEVSAFGRVEDPESRLSTISARVAGRIDKLFLQYTGQNVQRGQFWAECLAHCCTF